MLGSKGRVYWSIAPSHLEFKGNGTALSKDHTLVDMFLLIFWPPEDYDSRQSPVPRH